MKGLIIGTVGLILVLGGHACADEALVTQECKDATGRW